MRTIKSGFVFCLLLATVLGFGTAGTALGQDYATAAKTLVFMDRGLVWDSWTGNCHGLEANFAWFGKTTDYPGFEPSFIKTNVGGFSSHLYGSSWGYAALNKPGVYPGKDPNPDQDVLYGVGQDQGLIVNTNFADTSQQWVQQVSDFRWNNGENYYLKTNPLEAEEIVDAWQQWNPGYKWDPSVTYLNRHFLPIKRTYKVMLWTGQRQDQKYTIEELTIRNMSDQLPATDSTYNKTLYDLYVLKNYYPAINQRSWALMGQGSPAKDNTYIWDDTRNAMFIWADQWNSPLAPGDTRYNFIGALGPSKQGEYAASGHMGIGLLYATANKFGNESQTANYWNAICNNPGMGTDTPYQGVNAYLQVANGTRTAFALSQIRDANGLPTDVNYRKCVFSSHMAAGPWDLAPGQEIKVVQFQGVNGVDLEVSMNLNKMATVAQIATGMDSIKMLWDKAKLTTYMAEKAGYASAPQYQGWIHPSPPPCPYDFKISPYRGDNATLGSVAANIITWEDWAEKAANDKANVLAYGAPTLDNYTIWRSDYFAFMGWYPIANIKKGAAAYYTAGGTLVNNGSQGTYKYYDTNVKVGFSYFYALSSSDAGHTTWPPRPQAIAEYPTVFTGGAVPPQQTSIQASLNYHFDNTKWVAFRTQRSPGSSLSNVRVFPNPFVARAGYTNPTDADGIHFANIPAQCEIRIYTLRGDLVATGPGSITITQDAGSGEAVWKQLTSSEQFPKSGLYFYTLKALSGPDNGKMIKGKFVIVR